MEELKNTPVTASELAQEGRKPYEAPTAEIILLVPEEEMAWTYHDGKDADRWALNSWGYSALGDNAASAVTGTVMPDGWTLPTE